MDCSESNLSRDDHPKFRQVEPLSVYALGETLRNRFIETMLHFAHSQLSLLSLAGVVLGSLVNARIGAFIAKHR